MKKGDETKMNETNVFKLEKNKLEAMCINEDLSDQEKGEVIQNFMTFFDLTQKEVADLLGTYSQKVNRWVLIYKRMTELSPEIKEKVHEEADRTKLILLRVKDPNREKKQKFFLAHKKGLTTGEQENLISVLNGELTIEAWKDKIVKAQAKKMLKIRKIGKQIDKELLHKT